MLFGQRYDSSTIRTADAGHDGLIGGKVYTYTPLNVCWCWGAGEWQTLRGKVEALEQSVIDRPQRRCNAIELERCDFVESEVLDSI